MCVGVYGCGCVRACMGVRVCVYVHVKVCKFVNVGAEMLITVIRVVHIRSCFIPCRRLAFSRYALSVLQAIIHTVHENVDADG